MVLNTTSHQENANQNHSEIPVHTQQDGYFKRKEKNEQVSANKNVKCVATVGKCLIPQKVEQNYHMIQQFYFWVYIQNN